MARREDAQDICEAGPGLLSKLASVLQDHFNITKTPWGLLCEFVECCGELMNSLCVCGFLNQLPSGVIAETN